MKKQKEQPDGNTVYLTDLNKDLLTLYYLINTLYAVDTTVVIKHFYDCSCAEFKRDLKAARRQTSSKVMHAIYDLIYSIMLKNKELVAIKTAADGRITYRAQALRADARVLVNFLKYESEAFYFINEPEIELSESICERSLSPGVLAKRSFYCLRSSDGGEAFCDYLTVFNTCRPNGVTCFDYVSWLIANVNRRISLMNAADPTIRQLPSRKVEISKDASGKEHRKIISRYDVKNHIFYDKVDMTGLMPYDYARWLEAYKPKLESPAQIFQA